LGLLREETDGQESELICATRGTGFWINLDVPNADKAYARLKDVGVPIGHPPRTSPGVNASSSSATRMAC
jgi:hypothetical protein